MESKIIETIRKIEAQKIDERIEPNHALLIEIVRELKHEHKYDEISATLKKLVKSNKLSWGQTVNSTWFRIND